MSSQLKEDFLSLKREGLTRPAHLTNNEINNLNEDTQKVVIRYKHLLLHEIFTKTQGSKSKVAMKTGKNNGRTKIIKTYPLDCVKGDIISYPLEDIYSYIIKNSEELKGSIAKQIEACEHFEIKNIGTFGKIIINLGLKDIIDWNFVNLPLDQFKQLSHQVNKNTSPTDVIKIACSIGIKNAKNLAAGLKALGYECTTIRSCKLKTVEKIGTYLMETFPESTELYKDDILSIQQNLRLENNDSTIASVARFYGFSVNLKKVEKAA